MSTCSIFLYESLEKVVHEIRGNNLCSQSGTQRLGILFIHRKQFIHNLENYPIFCTCNSTHPKS